MSWLVERSQYASTINIYADTITCTRNDDFGSPINVLYNDPADRNGQYFWEVEFKNIVTPDRNSAVGLTTKQGFQKGYRLKAMTYLGNLSDGGSLLKQSFGDPIKQGDKIGILLQLSDSDMKMYLFHNERPLGLAFHIQPPYSKPLYPVISFNSNARVKMIRSQQIPKSLDREPLKFSDIEGYWKIINYPQHSQCVGCEFEIRRNDQDQNAYHLYTEICNHLSSVLKHNPTTNQWKSFGTLTTYMLAPPEEMEQENIIANFMSNIRHIVHDKKRLLIETNQDEQIKLERFIKEPPSPITKNIFTE